jgi:hypothetical protein
MTGSAHYLDSSLREKVLEHIFIGELLRCMWRGGRRDIEVLSPEVDRAGYDIVFEANGILRHVQFKASYHGSKTARVGIHTDLARKPGGCVIWIRFDPDTLELGPFLWFGGAPGEPMPPLGDTVGRHTRGNRTGFKAERQNIRIVAKGRFTPLATIDDVAYRLFGAGISAPR